MLQINPVNPYPDITRLLKRDLQCVSSKPLQNFRLIRAKSGVYVYRCLYDGIHAIVKYFEKEDGRREILNYRLLAQYNIPTIKTLALGSAALVVEDISFSDEWRLGAAEDFEDIDVARGLAHWYFVLHENGAAASNLDTLYFEYDSITEENLKTLIHKLPAANELFRFLLTRYGKFRDLIYSPSFTLTYNDFHWENFIVRNDKTAVVMFDYNLLGKGYRFSDFRNVCWSISEKAGKAFTEEYNRLFVEKHGYTRTKAEEAERHIDEVAGPLFELVVAFIENDSFPEWAAGAKRKALDGSLLSKAKQLLV